MMMMSSTSISGAGGYPTGPQQPNPYAQQSQQGGFPTGEALLLGGTGISSAFIANGLDKGVHVLDSGNTFINNRTGTLFHKDGDTFIATDNTGSYLFDKNGSLAKAELNNFDGTTSRSFYHTDGDNKGQFIRGEHDFIENDRTQRTFLDADGKAHIDVDQDTILGGITPKDAEYHRAIRVDRSDVDSKGLKGFAELGENSDELELAHFAKAAKSHTERLEKLGLKGSFDDTLKVMRRNKYARVGATAATAMAAMGTALWLDKSGRYNQHMKEAQAFEAGLQAASPAPIQTLTSESSPSLQAIENAGGQMGVEAVSPPATAEAMYPVDDYNAF